MPRDTIEAPEAIPAIDQWDSASPGTAYANLLQGRDFIKTSEWTCFTVHVHVVTAPTGTTPTLDVRVQHSSDGSNWVTLANFTQITAEGAYAIGIGPGTENAKGFGLFVRVVGKVGGVTPVWPFPELQICGRAR